MSCKRGILIVVSGPAGSGKGTVLNKVFEKSKDFVYSVSATTRDPRPGEVDGVHYHFITKERFEALIAEGGVAEHTYYCGNYYGTLRTVIEKDLCEGKNVVLEIEVDGAMQIKNKIPDALLILVVPPDFATLEARLRGRGTNTEEDIKNRLERSREELKFFDKYDYVLVNYDNAIDEISDKFISIIEAEKSSTLRNKDFYNKFFNI
ncbi:MAG: guanylate kinase [Ruminococcaceae bacterium]|nr:guanylate kinase [Oscillospiraceae bacterium]